MTTLATTLRQLASHEDFVDLKTIPGLRIELKYASTDNFMRKNVYAEFTEAFLHRLAADRLRIAITSLQAAHPGYELLIFDALRPRSVQRLLWAHVVGTPQEIYVANPDRGGMHNYGCAVDLTVVDDQGSELDMGTPFDSFTPLSQPKLEAEHLRRGELTPAQHTHRMILRQAMTDAGFLQLAHEWWHYDAFAQEAVRARFKIIE